ncbi:MAG: ABC-F family ATP-binding cassette domain-containing protein [Rhizobiales bacterium]|nr:ABC-F family ATP-binding cassette domain-containing protein [Hyphomicrobiales bacterium]
MLTIDRLTYRLGPRVLFDEASATLPPNARTGFVGRNGTGKTTLFRLVSGEIAPESGSFDLPRRARLGRVEQEAPGGPGKLIDFVLDADVERAVLLAEAETARDPHRIADIHTRLADIESHSAPARAAAILSGLGFDEAAQNRALSEFSGGWRMRVALAAVLFSRPDLLLLDEPTNYLDLEGSLWLIDYLKRYPATVIVISHDRDLLDEVCDHILHLDRGKLTLYRGGFTEFDRQRREKQALAQKAAKKQEESRKHLQAFVDRFRAKASKARQAQSRIKMLEKLQPVALIEDSDVLAFDLPSPERELSPPIVAMEKASAGYEARTVLSRLDLSISNDDRIGLLGANGNGKSTFAKLVAGRLPAMGGKIVRAAKLDVGFFAQHQIDDLDEAGSAYTHVARKMPNQPEAKVRARAARMGFPNVKADTKVGELSGGEKARLLMGLASFEGPHLLIMDEPTNHLDIDSRAALIEAINEYEGAVILVSHDRYLLEACADRLWLVADGTVKPFDGDMDEYRRFVLDQAGAARRQETREAGREATARDSAPTAPKRPALNALRKKLAEAEARMERFHTLIARVDEMLAKPDAFAKEPAKAAQLAQQRGELERALASAEEEWLTLSGELEAAG